MPISLSSMQPHIRSIPFCAAMRAMRRAGAMPPHFMSLTFHTPYGRGSRASSSASRSSCRLSSAISQRRTEAGSFRSSPSRAGGEGCSNISTSSARRRAWQRSTSAGS